MMAEEQGLLGMAFTNTSPMVIPTRGAKPTYGTNPIRSQALNINSQLTPKYGAFSDNLKAAYFR